MLRAAARFATTGYAKQMQKAFTMNAVRERLIARRPLTEGFFGRALFNIAIVATYLLTDVTHKSAKQTIVASLLGLLRVAHHLLPHMALCAKRSEVAESIAIRAGFG